MLSFLKIQHFSYSTAYTSYLLHRNFENAKVCKMKCLKLFVQFILNLNKVPVLMIFSRHCCQLSHLGSLHQNKKLPTYLSRYLVPTYPTNPLSSLLGNHYQLVFFYICTYICIAVFFINKGDYMHFVSYCETGLFEKPTAII